MSWPLGTVADIAEVISGFALKSEWFGLGDAKVIRIGDLQNGRIEIDGAETFDDKINQVREQFRINSGDILMALSGATVGKIAVADGKVHGAYLNQRVAIIRGKCQENTEYLKYVFSGGLLQKLLLNAGGAAQPNLSPKDLACMEIPLPPLAEQKRIAAILDKADNIRRKRQQAIKLADEFLRSVFLDMFGDPVANPKGWEVRHFNEIGKWASGGTPSRANDEFFKGSVNWYSAGELNSRYIDGSVEKISEAALKQSAAKIFPAGSMLVGMYDTAAFKISILKEDSSSNQACANITSNELINIEWFYSFIDFSKEHYLRQRRGVRQQNLNLGMIKEFTLPLPPRHEQDKFGEIVKKVSKLVVSQNNSLNYTNSEFMSLSQKAFQGEL